MAVNMRIKAIWNVAFMITDLTLSELQSSSYKPNVTHTVITYSKLPNSTHARVKLGNSSVGVAADGLNLRLKEL